MLPLMAIAGLGTSVLNSAMSSADSKKAREAAEEAQKATDKKDAFFNLQSTLGGQGAQRANATAPLPIEQSVMAPNFQQMAATGQAFDQAKQQKFGNELASQNAATEQSYKDALAAQANATANLYGAKAEDPGAFRSMSDLQMIFQMMGGQNGGGLPGIGGGLGTQPNSTAPSFDGINAIN